MQESGPDQCERCGGELRRVFFPTGIIFKGSGFYKTDSRSAGTPSTSGSTAPSTSAKPAVTSEKPSSSESSGDGPSSTSAPANDTGKKESA